MNKQPEIRFNHFNDGWKRFILAEILKVNSGRDYKKLNKGNIPVYGTGGYMLSVDDKLSSQDAIGIGRKGTIDKPQYLKAPFWTVDTLFFLTPLNENNLNFIYQIAHKIKWKKYSEQTGVPSLSKQTIEKISIRIPNQIEQQKIGEFFKQLDDRIVLQQNHIEQLKQSKQGFLQKMFPKDGESVPEVRFDGFNGDWKYYKFEDLLDKEDGIRRGPFGSALKKDIFVQKSNYVVYEQYNAIYDTYETRYNITEEKYNELHRFKLTEGDFILSGAGTIGRISRVPNGIKPGVINQALIRFKINEEVTDSEFFIQFVRSDYMQKHLTSTNPGSAMVNLVPMSEVKKWAIIVPEKKEQQKIGEFFKQLDDLIAKNERELELLQETKKGFLQKMFV